MKLLTLTSVLLAGIILKNIVRKEKKNQASVMNAFWEREKKAMRSISVPLDSLPFIQIPADLPLSVESDDPQVHEYQQIIRNLSNKRIINLNHKSNTELRLEYGVANFRTLSMADANFLVLSRTLTSLSEKYIAIGNPTEAQQLLDFALSIDSSVKKNEILLMEAKANEI